MKQGRACSVLSDMKFSLGQSRKELSHTLGFPDILAPPARPELYPSSSTVARAGSTYGAHRPRALHGAVHRP